MSSVTELITFNQHLEASTKSKLINSLTQTLQKFNKNQIISFISQGAKNSIIFDELNTNIQESHKIVDTSCAVCARKAKWNCKCKKAFYCILGHKSDDKHCHSKSCSHQRVRGLNSLPKSLLSNIASFSDNQMNFALTNRAVYKTIDTENKKLPSRMSVTLQFNKNEIQTEEKSEQGWVNVFKKNAYVATDIAKDQKLYDNPNLYHVDVKLKDDDHFFRWTEFGDWCKKINVKQHQFQMDVNLPDTEEGDGFYPQDYWNMDKAAIESVPIEDEDSDLEDEDDDLEYDIRRKFEFRVNFKGKNLQCKLPTDEDEDGPILITNSGYTCYFDCEHEMY